jgi:rhodanese-related sulfurtransferase
MDQLIEFTGNHWLLVLSFVAILGLLIHNITVGSKGMLTPVEATDMINHKEAVVVDVRPMTDFSKGHIINAINIPINSLKDQLSLLEKKKDKPVIVSCRSGAQSNHACKQLRNAGFQEVYNLKGGILAWQSANLPITKKRKGS